MRRFSPHPIAFATCTSLAQAGCVALAVLCASCSSTTPPYRETQLAEDPPRFSLVFVIHGDGDYVYYDTQGRKHRADEAVLVNARAIAERNPHAEVFIFHETRRKRLLFLIPRHDGVAYHYRNGRLVAEQSYWRDQGLSRFETEVEIYRSVAVSSTPRPIRLFFYFGHEIPEVASAGYDASYSNRAFTVRDLAEGVRQLAGDSTKVDMLVLGTCFGGTPYTIGTLAPYARYIIASPDNLHRSYFDLEPLERLDAEWEDEDPSAFANTFARHAFQQLTEEIQTAVSVVVYDTKEVRSFLDSVAPVYEHALTVANARSRRPIERCDCADDPAYTLPAMSEGLDVLYRAPRFGRSSRKQIHSGWECWRIVE